MEDLARALATRGFRITEVRLNTSDRRLPAGWSGRARLDAGDIVCLDGAEQLPAAVWLWFRWSVRRAGGLVITAHRRGRLPTLVECATTADLLDRIVRRLAPEGTAHPSPAALFARHRGNIRDALRELYDVHAAL
jgi:hypothetical protein